LDSNTEKRGRGKGLNIESLGQTNKLRLIYLAGQELKKIRETRNETRDECVSVAMRSLRQGIKE
jgi:hypothetical protein